MLRLNFVYTLTKFKNKHVIYASRDCPIDLVTDPRIIDTIEGETFVVKCMARNIVGQYRSWKKCKWERMEDNSSCRFKYHKIAGTDEYEVFDKCVGLDDHYFVGDNGLFRGKGNPYCGLNVNPTSVHDRGLWKCSLVFEDSKNKSRCTAETKILSKVKSSFY